MDELLVKYNTLSPAVQQEVSDFLDFVMAKHGQQKSFDIKAWKSKIKSISTWSPNDIDILEDSKNQFKGWKTEEW